MKEFLPKLEILSKLNDLKTSKWSLLEHLQPETRNSFQHNLFSPTFMWSFSNFHLVKLLTFKTVLFYLHCQCPLPNKNHLLDHWSSLLSQSPHQVLHSLIYSGTNDTWPGLPLIKVHTSHNHQERLNNVVPTGLCNLNSFHSPLLMGCNNTGFLSILQTYQDFPS